MGKDRLLWPNTSKLNIFSILTDYGLSGYMVFNRCQIRPAAKMCLKPISPERVAIMPHATYTLNIATMT